MRIAPQVLFGVLGLAAVLPACAATAEECLQFNVKPNGDAVFHNKCSDALNVLYCLESESAERSCSQPSTLVVTLHYGVTETLSGYVTAGKPLVRSAVCFYPEAPIKWQPGDGATWGCKKTCVMC